MKKLIVLGMVAAFACAAYAYPTLNGATGTGVLPNAKIAPAGTFQFAADYYDTADWTMSSEASYPLRASYAINDNFELSGAYTFLGDDESSWNVGAKYVFNLSGFDLALGGLYGDGDWEITTTQAYLAGDIVLAEGGEGSPAVTATLGANWTQLDGGPEADAFRGFAGLDVDFGAFSIVGDYQTKNDDIELEALYSVAARYQFTDMIGAQVGYTNAFTPYSAATTGWDEGNIFAGLNFSFGPGVECE